MSRIVICIHGFLFKTKQKIVFMIFEMGVKMKLKYTLVDHKHWLSLLAKSICMRILWSHGE